MSEHRSRVDTGGNCWAYAKFQGVTIYVSRWPEDLVVSVQGREDDAGGYCATWDSPAYLSGSEGYDIGNAWLDGDVPSEVYLDWLRENDTTGELEALLEGELKCAA
jgi:hypothetical protein